MHDPSPDVDLPPPIAVTIFCRVIDNLGDAGVCWRLARQLAGERRCAVTLYVDRPDVLDRLLDPADARAWRAAGTTVVVDGVRLARWPADSEPADWQPALRSRLVIAAFGCPLPPPVRAALSPTGPAGHRPALWVNLEYLSAETWIDDAHGLRSVKPTDGAVEYFVFPGFSPRSGGLLRERGLLARRNEFRARGDDARWLARHGVVRDAGGLLGSLFVYDTPQADTALAALADGPRALRLLVPCGVAAGSLARWAGRGLGPGETFERGALTLHGLPWLTQDDYDRLLWSCDLNFVRGEDSWVRAHWAGRPFLWQPYPQADDVHLIKLDAWLARLLADEPASLAGTIRECARAWAGAGDLRRTWPPYLRQVCGPGDGGAAYRRFAEALAERPDLASNLMAFAGALA